MHDTLDDQTDLVFWGYHMSEPLARNAAVRWAKAEKPGSRITILKVDLIQ